MRTRCGDTTIVDTTLVAERDGAMVGFVLGYLVPTTARDLFIWQVGVHHVARGGGIAGLMLDTLCNAVRPGALEATVTASNVASDALFRSFARRHRCTVEVSPCFGARHLPTGHEPEDLYRIDLRRPAAH